MADSVDVAEVEAWTLGLEEVHARIGWRFARSEPRVRVMAYVRGLLAPLERKNGWTLAEEAGESSPDGMQRLLRSADWDADGVRDDLRGYVIDHLGHPDAVLCVDETGFLKKGNKSAGVARQYSGTAGRVENCQVGVFLAYASPVGRTFIDRELYLPKAWTDDRARCQEARIPEQVQFATKPELAMAMIGRALDAEVPTSWVAADEVYGRDPGLRGMLEQRGVGYVLAVPVSQHVVPAAGEAGVKVRADAAAATLPPQAWKRISAGAGSKGPRIYYWARVLLDPVQGNGMRSWLLARRNLTDPTDLAYYLCHGPARTRLRDLVQVAGTRWAIEESFQTAKGQVGLDHSQVRRYDSWYRHITLSIFAHAFLTVIRAAASRKGGLLSQPQT